MLPRSLEIHGLEDLTKRAPVPPFRPPAVRAFVTERPCRNKHSDSINHARKGNVQLLVNISLARRTKHWPHRRPRRNGMGSRTMYSVCQKFRSRPVSDKNCRRVLSLWQVLRICGAWRRTFHLSHCGFDTIRNFCRDCITPRTIGACARAVAPKLLTKAVLTVAAAIAKLNKCRVHLTSATTRLHPQQGKFVVVTRVFQTHRSAKPAAHNGP